MSAAGNTTLNSRAKSARGVFGFTLIELMITLAIVAILSAIAFPAFQNYGIRAKRSAAQQFMLEVTSRQEQMLIDTRAYIAVAANADYANDPSAGSPGINHAMPNDVSANYNVVATLIAGPPPGYLITATPTGNQAPDGVLTLDALGVKTPAAKW